jgi:GntR family transcriptional regulator
MESMISRARGGGSQSSPVPKYFQLRETLLERINAGRWPAGTAIPTEPELCKEFGVSRITVRRAISDLVHEGKLYTIQGKGTFIARPKLDERFVQRAFGFYEDMELQGQQLTTQILLQEVLPAPEVAAAHLEIPAGSPVHILIRLRSVQDEKILVSTTYIPESLCPDLVNDELSSVSLYRWFQTRYGLTVARAERNLEAVSAREREARLLDIPLHSPLLRLESVVYLPNGKPLEYSNTLHRGDRTRVHISFVPSEDGQLQPTSSHLTDKQTD